MSELDKGNQLETKAGIGGKRGKMKKISSIAQKRKSAEDKKNPEENRRDEIKSEIEKMSTLYHKYCENRLDNFK